MSAREPHLDGHTISPQPASVAEQIRELVGARDLFTLLVQREIAVRYKQTVLGVVWVILQPLVPALILATVLGTLARLPSSGVPYLLFALCGLVVYTLFAGIVTRAGASLLADSRLMTKVYVPRPIVPLAAGSAAILDFIVGLLVVGAVMVAVHRPPGLEILLLPIVVGFVALAGLGVGLAFAALSAYYRDFAYVVPFLLQVLFYASPIVYSTELVPSQLRLVLALNPMVPLTEAFRWTLLGTPPPSGGEALLAAFGSVALLAAGAVVFERATRNLTDVI